MKARFFRSDAMSERHGETDEVTVESEWFQLTYEALRCAPDGDTVAVCSEGAWYIGEEPYSDVVIHESGAIA